MPKNLISVRISDDLLSKIEKLKSSRTSIYKVQGEYRCGSRSYVLLENGIYSCRCSTADIIEVALLDFFEKHNI